MIINKDQLKKVWFPTVKELSNHMKYILKPLNLSQKTINIIMKHYNKTISNIKNASIDNEIKKLKLCPHCNAELKELKYTSYFNNRTWKKYSCPNWPRCDGIIRREWIINNTTLANLQKDFTISWLSKLEQDLKNNNVNLSRQLIYRFLSENKLASPQKYIKIFNNEHIPKSGWEKAKENSKKTEEDILDILQEKYPDEKILYQQYIFYKLKNNSKIFHKIPDFIINFTQEPDINIVEAKESDWYGTKEEEQLTNYKILLEFMFPLKQINAYFYSKKYNTEIYEKTLLENIKNDN